MNRLNFISRGCRKKWRNSMRIGEECPYLTPCKWCCKFDAPCEEVLKDIKERRMKKEERKSDER